MPPLVRGAPVFLTATVFALAAPVAANSLDAERVRLTAYTTSEGLAHFAVNRIVLDSRGFIWFCTREGLSMFDGYEFKSYRTPDGLPSANVLDILETPDGLYWIGTLEGLVVFDPAIAPGIRDGPDGSARARFTTVPIPGDSRAASVSTLVRDHAGTIWVGTSAGLFRIQHGAPDARPLPLDLGIPDRLTTRAVQSLLVDREGSLWIATGPGIFVRRADGVVRALTHDEGLPQGFISALVQDRAGRIWAATANGIWQLTATADGTPRLVRTYGETEGLTDRTTTRLFEAADGSFWVGSVQALWRLEAPDEPHRTRFIPVRGYGTTALEHVTALAEHPNGDLWIGTGAAGALRLPRAGFSAVAASADIRSASAITQAADGNVAFIGRRSDDWAVFCSDGRDVHPVRPGGPVGPPSWAWGQVLLQGPSGDWWLGTTRGVVRYVGARTCADLHGRHPVSHFDTGTGLTSDTVIRLFEDSQRNAWIATVGHGVAPEGLARWDRERDLLRRFSEADGLPRLDRYFASSFVEDRAGNVWIGFSRDGGLARYRNGRFELFTAAHGLPVGQVRDLVVDASGRLWIASFRAGVTRVDDPTASVPRFRVYTTADGLASNETYALVLAEDDRLYIASAGGVDRLDPAAGVDRHYSYLHGLPTGEINAGVRDGHGTIWFTQTTGLIRFKSPTRATTTPPRVLITAVSVNGDPQPVSAVGQQEVAAVRLPYGATSIHAAFVAVGSGPLGAYRYRYKLENVSASWSAFSDARSVNFANLPPGSYRLLVEAKDASGQLALAPASVAFTIVPPVWQRGWFIGAAMVVLLATGYGLHRYRVSRLVAIARIRDRIATDLHDDLGANLTKIAVLGEVARHSGTRQEAALASIASIARESVTNMSDIVWAIDPARDTTEDLARKMRQHASETLALGDVELAFEAPRATDHRYVGIDLRHDLYLLYKEVINNIARHSRCQRVEVELRVHRHHLQLRVNDDGIGFDSTRPTDGLGLSSMRKRAARMGGTLQVDSSEGSGTRVILRVPLSRTQRVSRARRTTVKALEEAGGAPCRQELD